MLDPLLEQLLAGFVDEAQEIAARLTGHLIELEKGTEQRAQAFDGLARGLHTLKGSSATLGLDALAELAHRMEDLALPLRGSEALLPSQVADALLRTLDVWMAHLRAINARLDPPSLLPSQQLLAQVSPGGAPEPVQEREAAREPPRAPPPDAPAAAAERKLTAALNTPAPPAPAAAISTTEASHPRRRNEDRGSDEPAPQPSGEEQAWRVTTRQVVGLLHEVERLREVRLRLEERRRELDRALQQLDRLGIQSETSEARALLLSSRRSLTADGDEAADIVASMEDGLKAISTMPVRTVLEPLRRAVRDLTQRQGKRVNLSVVGAEVSLDRRVLEALRAPLVHLVRNAVDHGLELPALRESRGKHGEGALIIRVEQQGNMLFIEVADDGNGLDVQRIKEAALRRGIASEAELASMGIAQIHQLIFRPGFSTRTEISDISGRGVGLDVVRNEIQGLQGHVEVQSTPGQGTRFILTLPAELGSSPVLVVRCGEHQLGIPMAAVESSRASRKADVRVGRARLQLQHREELLPLHDFGALLGLRQPEAPSDGQPILILASQGKRLALSVDDVLGDKELVIRPLPAEVRELPAYQGAATLARGELVLIVRADWVVNQASSGESVTATRRALVVDDSLTARALHRTALEAGGYQVHTASSGKQALEQLRHAAYDVMVSDIGMEEMDGFELTAQVRRRAETDSMPVILVSARDSAGDRQHGAEAGADGYLSKKDCVSGRLLAEVAAVIARRKGA
jgi:chemotaxis protein histidine kinase CheA